MSLISAFAAINPHTGCVAIAGRSFLDPAARAATLVVDVQTHLPHDAAVLQRLYAARLLPHAAGLLLVHAVAAQPPHAARPTAPASFGPLHRAAVASAWLEAA